MINTSRCNISPTLRTLRISRLQNPDRTLIVRKAPRAQNPVPLAAAKRASTAHLRHPLLIVFLPSHIKLTLPLCTCLDDHTTSAHSPVHPAQHVPSRQPISSPLHGHKHHHNNTLSPTPAHRSPTSHARSVVSVLVEIPVDM
ncbi:hypothetical protein K438DRAFT_1993343 [Mycena galopus ATCC 62051]|nr:hypothetical protein K438DRAFT_1993343 [Mycena galopus ATCC 62051]